MDDGFSELERDTVATKQIIGRMRKNAALVMRLIEGSVSRDTGKRAAFEIVEDSFQLAKLFAIPESQIDA